MKNFPEKLKSARKMKGFSMQDLVDRMEKLALKHTITKQSISKYETGEMKPDSEMLGLMCKALELNPDYFTRPAIELEEIEYRKKVDLSSRELESIKEQSIYHFQRYLELEEILGEEKKFTNPISEIFVDSEDKIEEAAEKLREKWCIGSESPISNVIELLEEQGIKVFELETSGSFDGCKASINGFPVIVLNTKVNKSIDRKRFSVLHELGHIVLNFDPRYTEKEVERLCHSFAGAFLIPKAPFKREFGGHRQNVLIKELILLKQIYGISIQAIMARAKKLGLITESHYKNFSIFFSKLGYRTNEPGVYSGIEKSNRFEQLLVRAVGEEIISYSKAAALKGVNLSAFRDYLASIN
jgi:Zn-dependent peptidase ImmA (M78 family)/transcriptional regulator with XRE-family HTH domain